MNKITSAIFRESYKKIPYLLLLALLGFYFFEITYLQSTFSKHPWIAGDWLINYSGGLIRRGFIGSLIIWWTENFNQQPLTILLGIKKSLYLIWLISFYVLALRKKIGLFELILSLSPWAFLFDLHDPQGSGRKELILFSVFTIYLLLTNLTWKEDRKLIKNWQFYFLLITLPLMTMIHEGLFFFFPFFFITHLKNGFQKDQLRVVIIPYFLSFIILLVLYFRYGGDPEIANSICKNLTANNLPDSICNGSINSISNLNIEFNFLYLKTYIPIFLLTFIPLFIYIKLAVPDNLIGLYCKSFIFILSLTLPLYFIAIDWGRWIHISAILMFTSILGIKSNILRLSIRQIIGTLIAGYFYIFYWIIPHSIGGLNTVNWLKSIPDNPKVFFDLKKTWMQIKD